MLAAIKIFKLPERKKKCMQRNIFCTKNEIFYQCKQGIVLSEPALWNNYMKQARKLKSFLFNAAIPPLLVTVNFSQRNWKTYQEENSNLALEYFDITVIWVFKAWTQRVLKHNLSHPLLNIQKHKFCKWKKYFILRGLVDIICPSKELPVQSYN